MKHYIFLIFLFLTLSCNFIKDNDKKTPIKNKDSINTNVLKPNEFQKVENDNKDLIFFYKDTNLTFWSSPYYITKLYIGEKKVNIEWEFRCEFKLKSKLVNNKIILYWNYTPNGCCRADINFFKKIKEKGPNFNAAFAEFQLINDSTGYMNYYYKNWIDEINNKGNSSNFNDSIFPKIFIRC